ncbi:MAG: hypothetical protein ACLFVI_01395 [Archaeoglobaceae archaeon]
MGLKEDIVDYFIDRCAEEGFDVKPRISEMANKLGADENEVTKVVKELESEGVISYEAEDEPHVCPAISLGREEDKYIRWVLQRLKSRER